MRKVGATAWVRKTVKKSNEGKVRNCYEDWKPDIKTINNERKRCTNE